MRLKWSLGVYFKLSNCCPILYYLFLQKMFKKLILNCFFPQNCALGKKRGNSFSVNAFFCDVMYADKAVFLHVQQCCHIIDPDLTISILNAFSILYTYEISFPVWVKECVFSLTTYQVTELLFWFGRFLTKNSCAAILQFTLSIHDKH